MYREKLWRVFEGKPGKTVVESLSHTSFDDMFEFSIRSDHYHNLYHRSTKYNIPVLEGRYSQFYRYSLNYLVHPDDQELFRELLAPERMAERMADPNSTGIHGQECRVRVVGGDWIWTRQIVVYGMACGLEEGTARCYIYDVQIQHDREAGGEGISPAMRFGLSRDDVTGLLQEYSFFSLAQDMLSSISGQWCIVDIDIEHHTLFTEWFGYEKEHYLLAEFGRKIKALIRKVGGIAGYRGADHFTLMMPYNEEKIRELQVSLQKSVRSQSHMEGFAPMFGIAMIDGSSDQIVDYFNHAVITTEGLRNDYRTRIRVFDPLIKRTQEEEYKLLNEFQHAIEDGEICFWLQPQCRVSNGKLIGAESLARWQRKDGSQVPPAKFIPLLEKFGLVTQLDLYIWESVCRWIRSMMDQGRAMVPISVNVSQLDIFTIDIPVHFEQLTKKYRIPASSLKIEITESAYVEDSSKVRDTVSTLRSLGFMVLMDDFGSGYSSLNMLRSVNVDVIKLDAQFLRIEEKEEQKGINIIESIINMAKTLHTPVIVEGVETREQAEFLTGMGCRYMQGFYYYRPMPVERFEKMLEDSRMIDGEGLLFQSNRQMRVREMLDESIYSDTMLNAILGPVAFYNVHDGQVDIVRYNEQFYELVGIPLSSLNERMNDIGRFIFPEDREKFMDLLDKAEQDRFNGARGIVRVYLPDGTLTWISLKAYCTGEDKEGKKFYVSMQDVSEMQYVNADLPGGYFRCTVEDGMRFLYVSPTFEEMVGYTWEQIEERFDNRLINMIHPGDRHMVEEQSRDIANGERVSLRPYRLMSSSGEAIFVAEQTRLTKMFGAQCWQSMAIDVTEVMKTKHQLHLLEKYYTDSLMFMRETPGGRHFEFLTYGLENELGMDREEALRHLNDGTYMSWIRSSNIVRDGRVTLGEGTRRVEIGLPGGENLILQIKRYVVSEEGEDTTRIVVVRRDDRVEKV